MVVILFSYMEEIDNLALFKTLVKGNNHEKTTKVKNQKSM